MSLLDNPSHWLARAAEIRRLAAASADLIYRAKLEKLAASYEEVAVRAMTRMGWKNINIYQNSLA